MAIVSSFHFYVLWKTEFQVVYIRIPALSALFWILWIQ